MSIEVTLSNPRPVGELWGYLPSIIQLRNGDILAQTCWCSDRHPTEEEQFAFYADFRSTTEQDWMAYNARCEEQYGLEYCNALSGMWARSTDGGKTFTATGLPPVINYIQKENGDVIGLQWYTYHDVNGKPIVRSWTSHDNCHSWDVPHDIPLECPPLRLKWLFPHRRILHLEGDTYLVLIYGYFEGDEQCRSMVFRTTDDFKTLHYYSTVATWNPNVAHPKGFNETDMTRTADGRLLCVIRNQGFYPLYQSFSEDNGKTWSPVQLFPACGVAPVVRTLQNGVVVCSHGRPGVHLTCSENHGEGWQSFTTILARSELVLGTHDVPDQKPVPQRTCGYTDIAVTGPDTVTVFYTAPRDWNDETIITPWKPEQRRGFRLYAIDAKITTSETIMRPGGFHEQSTL